MTTNQKGTQMNKEISVMLILIIVSYMCIFAVMRNADTEIRERKQENILLHERIKK